MRTPTWSNLARTDHRLVVAPGGRHLAYADGAPFFYLGDTAWSLFHRLNLEEALHYLRDRSRKGFTVIQANVIGELGGLDQPNAQGDLPFAGRDLARPVEAYFAHIDRVVTEANRLGLLVGMLPCWNRYADAASAERLLRPDNAAAYGRYLGERFRDAGLIWILGGDFNANTPEEQEAVRRLAAGLRTGDRGAHRITYHPMGPGRSSDRFHAEPWLDFNMIQSSHAAHGYDNGLMTERDHGLVPAKPTLDGEPRYEGIVAGFYFETRNPADRCTDFDARHGAYASLLAGACGHTYGNNNIWQMWAPGRDTVIWADTPWWDALEHPGSFQMAHVRRLFESRPWTSLLPAQDALVDAPRHGPAKVRLAVAADRRFAFAYAPLGDPFTVDLERVGSRRVRQTWFDPRYGTAHTFHTGCNTGYMTFTPPTRGNACDWVLVLDDPDAGFGPPGARG